MAVYPAFLVILLLTGNIEEGIETTGKIRQFEIKENSPFY
jgi:hypothetical protein